LIDLYMEKNLLRNFEIFRVLFVPFLALGLFANSLMAEACFCGEACRHGFQGNVKTKVSFQFHNRCSGTQCKSCNFEDAQTLKASNACPSTVKLKILDTSFTLFNLADYQSNKNFIKSFLSRIRTCVKIQSPPKYLQNLSLLL